MFFGGAGLQPIMSSLAREGYSPIQTRTERIPTRVTQASGLADGGGINRMPTPMFNSQAIFQNYMRGLFNNPYMPPSIPGIFGPTGNGYSGFMSPNMGIFRQSRAPAAAPVQQPIMSGNPGIPYVDYDPNESRGS